ncbi:MAG: NTP transferase domain-containing protein [Candidatus Tectomicrobia bacterium]|uniref:NTP transferase domain-containing protein n=1 Tax=Tectimicrobiota bacterium TaxID=2528274 RepID=A0A932GRJ7_UNCTE|nr:NTP transferase domain-containing protein [Candidatus Tectomicrobia bacterium]
MNPYIYAVILAGGEGTRFWPLSRKGNPKQFLRVLGDRSLLQQTVDRIAPLIPQENTYVVTLQDQRRQVLDQIPWLLPDNVLGEPCGRNTAPAIALAAVHLKERGGDGVMVVLAADHLIGDADKFVENLRVAAEFAAQEDLLVTLGIRPKGPETAYGYIRLGPGIKEIHGYTIYAVEQFVEKPDRAREPT